MDCKLEILPIDETDETKRKKQIVEKPKGAIVLVHGICHGAWCWENFINFFADHEYQCYAISLPGHGKSEGKERLQEFTLSDYVDAVKRAMKTIKADMANHGLKDVKPFLLGHSMGGAVVQQYIGKYEDDVQGAVLFAPATAPHMKREDVLRLSPINLPVASCIAISGCHWKVLVHNAAFFTGEDENGKKCQRVKDVSPYRKQLQKESKKIIGAVRSPLKYGLRGIIEDGDLTRVYSENYHLQIPVLVIGSLADCYFGEESLKQTADEYAKNDSKTALVLLDRLCHDMMLDDYEPKAWEKSAKPVLSFIEKPTDFVNDLENR